MSSMFCTFSFGQATIENCPNPITNVVISNPSGGSCVSLFSLDSYPTSPTPGATVTWFSAGSTTYGSFAGRLDISEFDNMTFNFGLTTITFVADDGNGTDQCSTIIFVSEEADLPTTTCDPITVDLNGECTDEVRVPYDMVNITTDICDPTAIDSVSLAWNMTSADPAQRTIIVNAHDGNPSFYSLYLRKYRDDVLVRQATCLVEINVINGSEPALVCPTSETILVAPECTASYTYDVEGASILPCDGSINMTMPGGGPSGTPLVAGVYDYGYELLDNMMAQVTAPAEAAPCTWTVTVEESDQASTSLSCIGQINLSIDQDCQAILEVPNILTGSNCSPMAMFTLSVNIPGEGVVTGSSITFTDAHVGQSFDVSVIGPNGLNTCWGRVTIEDKVGPAIICPTDLTIQCTMPTDTSATGVPTLVGVGCEDITISYSDAVVNTMCEGEYQSVISRRFYATDGAGNVGPACVQTIYIERETLMSALFPPHWDGLPSHTGIQDNGVGSNDPLTCDGAGVVFNTITREDGRVVPSPYADGDLIGTGAPGGVGTCGTIQTWYEDLIIEICEDNCSQSSPSYKVLRTWDVFDWCTGNTTIHQQVIKVMDTLAPEFVIGVPDLTVSTDLWGCGATINLPTISAVDNCSNEVSYSWNVSGGSYDPATNRVYVSSNALTTVGNEVLLIAYAEDCCGNISIDTGLVTIIDQVPPVVIADEHTVVTLNNQSGDGSTKVYASTFDDGSFDGCGPIEWWVRRMDNACADYDGLDDEGNVDGSEVDETTTFQKYIHFCCDDLAEDQMVVFMVCDDGDNDGIVEMNGDDNCSTAMVLVDVQDKLAPTINCPAPTTINCIDFVAYENLLDTELTEDNITKLNNRFGIAWTNSTCGDISGQTFTSNLEEVCGTGAVTRTFTVTTDNGQATCSQAITITVSIDNVMSCDRISFPAGSAERNAGYDWCDPSDEVAPFILKPVQVFECGSVSITRPVLDIDNLCTEVGVNLTLDTFDFAGGACIKILAHWEVIDQCLFQENFLFEQDDIDEVNPFVNENGYYELYVEYDIFDTDPPTLACDDVTVTTADCEYNFDTFTMTATDDCTADDLISITYKVDFDHDGDYDYPATGSAAEGNSFDAKSIGGLPIGEHAIKWIAYDGCGNYSVCTQVIEVVKSDKAPTPYCHLGLSSAVMDSVYGCSVEIWATDFVADQGFGACGGSLTYLMIPYYDIYGEPADLDDDLSVEDALGQAQPAWELGCKYIENGKAHVIEIRIYAIDEDGNYDFCDASLTLNDNFDCCPDLEFGASTMIAGSILSSEGTPLEEVNVSIMSNEPEFPRIQSTSNEGSYTFNGLKYEKNFELSAANNENTKEGVTTLDLVLIQRHILGIAVLDSPYKVIAADVNGNGKVSAVDLLQLRKLILGLYPGNKLPENTSWRYVNSSFEFSDALNPFPFTEKINVSNLNHAMYNQNFIGVKTGDVNGSISALLNGSAQVRSAQNFNVVADNKTITKGSVVSVDFTVEDAISLYGMQFGVEFNSEMMNYNKISSDALEISEANVNAENGLLSISWNEIDLKSFDKGEVLFSIEFTSNTNGKIADYVSLNDQVLTSEVYNEKLEIRDAKLNFRSVISDKFVLLQNEPNPFATNTSISFELPEEGIANLKVYDVTGKVVLERNEGFVKGLNTIVIKKSDIGTSGIMYYQLTFGNDSATRKMILLD